MELVHVQVYVGHCLITFCDMKKSAVTDEFIGTIFCKSNVVLKAGQAEKFYYKYFGHCIKVRVPDRFSSKDSFPFLVH